MRPIVVDIENLVLKGFHYEDRSRISEGLKEELARLLAPADVRRRLSRAGELPAVRAGDATIGADMKPREIGAAVARTVAKGLMR